MFYPVWPWNLTDDLIKTIGHLFYAMSRFVRHFVATSEFNLSYSPELLNWGNNRRFFCRVWPWNLTDDIKNIPCYLKLCTSFRQFWSKSAIFCPVWPCNLLNDTAKQYVTPSLLCQAFCVIPLPSMNYNWSCSAETQTSGENWQLLSRVTLKCDV